ncbi:hypothetical protein [Kocuria palustris]|uniref:hypothetical protein n=1 Tax=Kocuria palustris TaxID=71999 RepID=UPI00119FB8CC|nr:hypothetical protein [Kocuria palustris]
MTTVTQGPSGTAQRDDVAAALEAVQRQCHQRWWYHVPEGLALAGIVVWTVHPDIPILVYTASLMVLLLPRFLYQRHRGMAPRLLTSNAAVITNFVGIGALLAAAIVAALIPGGASPLKTGILAVVMAALLASTFTIADRGYVRDLPRLGVDLAASAPEGPQPAAVLGDSRALRTMVILAGVRQMRGWALRDALGTTMDETRRAVEPLEGQGLIKGFRELFGSRRAERRWYRITAQGERVLRSHLAAPARGTA